MLEALEVLVKLNNSWGTNMKIKPQHPKVLIIVTEPPTGAVKQLLQDLEFNPGTTSGWRVERIGASKGRDYGVNTVPSFIRVDDGKVTKKYEGYLTPEKVMEFLK